MYLDTFELNEEDLLKVPEDKEIQTLTCKTIHTLGVGKYCTQTLEEISEAGSLKVVLPCVCIIFSGITSYKIIYKFLHQTINELAQEAELMPDLRVKISLSMKVPSKLGIKQTYKH